MTIRLDFPPSKSLLWSITCHLFSLNQSGREMYEKSWSAYGFPSIKSSPMHYLPFVLIEPKWPRNVWEILNHRIWSFLGSSLLTIQELSLQSAALSQVDRRLSGGATNKREFEKWNSLVRPLITVSGMKVVFSWRVFAERKGRCIVGPYNVRKYKKWRNCKVSGKILLLSTEL